MKNARPDIFHRKKFMTLEILVLDLTFPFEKFLTQKFSKIISARLKFFKKKKTPQKHFW